MLPDTEQLLRDPGTELVFGLVGPVGTDLDLFERDLCDHVRQYGYTTVPIRLSALLKRLKPGQLGVELKEQPEYERLTSYMDAGNQVRKRTSAGEILALWAVAEIKAERAAGKRRPKTAHILRSIKHPDEARALRAVYGPGFYLIAVAATEHEQIDYLTRTKGLSREQAIDVIQRDKGEEHITGQHMREAFELADVFIRQDPCRDITVRELERFLRLVFGTVVETPTVDEHAMFLAYAASLRSGDLSRQVGAVVWRESVGPVATGCNDVPAPGGGLYPRDGNDQRDHVLGHDANERHKKAIANEVVGRVLEFLGKADDPDLRGRLEKACEDTRLLDITEFGRAVHAEMDAMLSCARAGISISGCTLYTTTFPCHNCAKHIIAAGIRRVVYVEPYEKSQAFDLHGDAIRPGEFGSAGPEERNPRVTFEPFVGVGPRRYFDLFSMRLSDGYNLKRKIEGQKATWDKTSAVARVPMLPTSYIDRETQLAGLVPALLEALR